MNLEIQSYHKDYAVAQPLPPHFIENVIHSVESRPFYFYADTSKTSGQERIYPPHLKDVNLEEVEKRLDDFLFAHWSLYEKSGKHWPRLHTTTDPKENVTTVYRIMEFPVVIDGNRLLSVKQSVRENETLIALSYGLVTLD